MNRIFLTSEIDDIISTDREIIKSVLDLIEDIKKVASESSSDAARVSSEAKKGDVSGAAATVKSCIENDAYSQAKTKLKCVENNIKGIKMMDKLFAKQMSTLSQSTNKIKGVIKELDSFIINTPLNTPASEYNAALSAKMTVWEKILKDADASVEAIKMMAKGAEKFSAIFSSDPVNLSTGNFIYEKTDLEYGGNGRFCFKRFYNSVNDYEGILGKDWITNYEVHLSFIESNVFDKKEISIIKEDGKEEIFLPVDEKRYTPQSNSLAEINVIENGFEYKTIEGNRYLFDKEGFLERYEDRNGQGYSTEYSQIRPISKSNETIENSETAENRRVLQRVIKDSGECFVFEYSKDGFLKKIKDSEGRTVDYEVTEGKLCSVTRPDGTTLKYTYSANGKLRGVENPQSIISVENEYDQSFRVIKQLFPDGTSMSYAYDDEKGIVTQTERNGSITTHYHDEYYRNVKNVYPDGEETFEYNNRGLKTKIKDKNGFTTNLIYDNRGNLSGIINPLGVKANITYNSFNKPMTASIDGKEKIHNSYDEKGNLIETTDSLGRKTVIKYGITGKPVCITLPDGGKTIISYDDRGNIVSLEDSQGNITHYTYDNFNRIVKIKDPMGGERCFEYDVMDNIISETNQEGLTRRYNYNESGKVIEIVDYDGNKLKRSYNALNKLVTSTDKDGKVTKLQYDAMWNVARITAPDGATITYLFNENNRLSRIKDAMGNVRRFKYDGMGNRLSIEDEEGAETRFTYDAIGRLSSTIDQEGNITAYEYDSEGHMIKITDPMGNVLNREYNSAGELTKEEYIPNSDREMKESRVYEYDLLGNISSITTQTGYKTKYNYLKGTNKITEVIYPDGTKDSYTYNANGFIETHTNPVGYVDTYIRDSMNRLIEVKGAEGESRRYTYDALGNISSMVDPLGNTTKYEYTLSGKLAKVTNALGNTLEYTFDANGRVIGVYQNGDVDELPRRTEYKRDILGRVETVIDAFGQEEHYKYNKRGDLIEKIDKDGYLTKLEYTVRGDIEKIQYSDGKEVVFSYDALRHLSEVKDWLGLVNIDNDSRGKARKVTYPDGREVSYSYSDAGLRNSIVYPDGREVKYIYDEFNKLRELQSEEESILYNYDKSGRLVQKLFPNGSQTNYKYNDRGLISGLIHSDDEGIVDEYLYSYDDALNKTEIVKNRRGLDEESGIYSYSYDEIGRLKTVTKDKMLLREYSYDSFGNRLSLEDINAGISVSYSYNPLNQLTEKMTLINNSFDSDGKIEKESYSYDKRGNLTEIFDNNGVKNRYVYGALNKMEEALDSDGYISKYLYCGLGHRIGKEEYFDSDFSARDKIIESITEDSFLQLNKKVNYTIDITKQYNNVLEKNEISEINQLTELNNMQNNHQIYIWDNAIVSMSDNGHNSYYFNDELDSPVRIQDEKAELLDSYGYDEFGRDLYENQGKIQPFGYTGYQMDLISGSYFAQAREYRPDDGRFNSVDIVKGHVTDSQTQNNYIYCINNPIIFIDRDGREESPFVSVYALYNSDGAYGQGHAATLLVREDGTGVFYSWAADPGDAAQIVAGMDVPGYLSKQELNADEVQRFLTGSCDNPSNCSNVSGVGKVSTDGINGPIYDDTYNEYVKIDITDAQGQEMYQYAEDLVNGNGNGNTYNLYANNCGMVQQQILNAAGLAYGSTGASALDEQIAMIEVVLLFISGHPILAALLLGSQYLGDLLDGTIPNADYAWAKIISIITGYECGELGDASCEG